MPPLCLHVIGTHAGSMGASFSHYTGPTASSEQQFGALPSIEKVAGTARRYVYLAQPNSGVDDLEYLLSSPQKLDVLLLGVPTLTKCGQHIHKMALFLA